MTHAHEQVCVGTKKKSTCSQVAANKQIVYLCIHCSMTCDWMRVDCSHPVSRPDLSAPAPLFEHLTFARKRWEKTSQRASQLDRKRSSKGVRGCSGWFMPCSGMLNEFRVQFCYGNWLNGHCLLSQWHTLILRVVIMQMSKCDVLLMSHGTFNTSRGRQRKEMNHCTSAWISCQCSDGRRVGQPVGGWLPSKSEKIWYASLRHLTTQSRSFSEWLLYVVSLWVCVPV